MKKIIIFTLALFIGSAVYSMKNDLYVDIVEEDTAVANDTVKNWTYGAVASLNFAQVALVNWSAGGANSLSTTAFFSGFINYKKGKSTWSNNLDLAYGLIKTDDGFDKLDDKIDFTSKYGQYAFEHWYYTGLLDFKTQFTSGFDAETGGKISDFMAPGYLNFALGMDFVPNDHFSLFLSPITAKLTFVRNDSLSQAGAFGINPGDLVRPEFGGYIKATYHNEIFKNVELKTSLDLFSNYLENPENIDINWQMLIAMKINKWLSASISTTLIYDDDIDINIDNDDDGIIDAVGPRVQFKEAFALGFSIQF